MHKRILFVLFVCLSILLCLLNFTNPSSCGPFGVLLFFTTLYGCFFCFSFLFISVFFLILGKKSNTITLFYSFVVGFGPILFLFLINFDLNYIMSLICALIFVVLGSFLVKSKFSVVK